MYIISCLYCMPTSLKHPGGAGLGAYAGPKVYRKLLEDCGYSDIDQRVDSLGLTYRCFKSCDKTDENSHKKRKTGSSTSNWLLLNFDIKMWASRHMYTLVPCSMYWFHSLLILTKKMHTYMNVRLKSSAKPTGSFLPILRQRLNYTSTMSST